MLTPGPSFPVAGFAGASGAIGLLEPFPFPPFSVGPPVTIFSMDFTPLGWGSSTVGVVGTPFSSAELASFGVPVPLSSTAPSPVSGSAAAGQPIPEPGTVVLMGLRVAGMALYGVRRRRQRR